MTDNTESVELVETPTTPSLESIRSIRMSYNRQYSRMVRANEVALKGLYVDWAFDKLNLSQYR